ncbi:MAG: acyl-CoA dehydrogenase [Thermoleophilia bacterium]|nr:acyl-CoA dehydrogenase [Thermoleophilia bacterium]
MTTTPTTAPQFSLTDDQRDVQAMVREFAAARITPNAAEWDRNHTFDRALYAELAELGLMGICVPTELGGAGMDFLSYVLAVEELSRADAGVGVTIAVHTSASTLPIVHWGTEAQQQAWVPKLASGEWIGSFALTESGAGSDAGSMLTRADEQADGGFRITGRKQWITNGAYAGSFITFARSEPGTTDASGVSAFLVAGDSAGLSVGRVEEKLGLNSSNTVDMVYDDVSVGADLLLGTRGKGFRIAMQTLDGGRITIAAQALGIAQAAFDLASSYAKERTTFGKPIGSHQGIAFKLAEMSVEIEAARALTYRAAALKMAGQPHTVEGAQAKLFASGVARRVTGEAIQVLGGYGYSKEFPAERYYRDAKITEIYEGTSEIQKLVIARRLLGLDVR